MMFPKSPRMHWTTFQLCVYKRILISVRWNNYNSVPKKLPQQALNRQPQGAWKKGGNEWRFVRNAKHKTSTKPLNDPYVETVAHRDIFRLSMSAVFVVLRSRLQIGARTPTATPMQSVLQREPSSFFVPSDRITGASLVTKLYCTLTR